MLSLSLCSWFNLMILYVHIAASDMEISETVGRILEMCPVNTASIIQGLTTGNSSLICFVLEYQNLSCYVKNTLVIHFKFLLLQLQEEEERVLIIKISLCAASSNSAGKCID